VGRLGLGLGLGLQLGMGDLGVTIAGRLYLRLGVTIASALQKTIYIEMTNDLR